MMNAINNFSLAGQQRQRCPSRGSTRRNSRWNRRIIVALGVFAVTLTAAPQVSADQIFHTERMPLFSVSGAPIQLGFVVDIHASGPKVFALERYVVVGAAPASAYQVEEVVFPASTTCTGAAIVPSSTALQTNVAGNGEAEIVITPAQIPTAAHNTVSGIVWQMLNLRTGVVDYQTHCAVVAVD